MKEELAIISIELETEIKKCDDTQKIFLLAQETSNKIIKRVTEIQQNIEYSKTLNNEAQNASTDYVKKFLSFGFAGKSATDKRSELNTRINSLQNEAISDLNTMMQEITKLTMISSYFSNKLAQFLSQAMEEGFRDSNGQLKQCDGNVKNIIKNIILISEQAVAEQTKNQERERILNANTEQINKNLESINIIHTSLKNKSRLDDEQTKDISSNTKNIKDNKQLINNNKNAIEDINKKIEKKDLLDDEQSKDILNNTKNIADNKQYINKNADAIDSLNEKIYKNDLLDNERDKIISELEKKLQDLSIDLQKTKGKINKISTFTIIISAIALIIGILCIIKN